MFTAILVRPATMIIMTKCTNTKCPVLLDMLSPFSPSVTVVAAAVEVVAGVVGVKAAVVEESPSLAVFSGLSLL